jgi:mediator of RNA polymerase II transcription subunit 31
MEVDAASASAAAASSAAGSSSSAIAAPSPPDPLHLSLMQDSRLRFQLELEFVSLLANPHYLHHLAQAKYLEDPAFLNYISYLQYFHQPAYLPFMQHPHALYFLDLLLLPAFRQALLNPQYVSLLFEQQFWTWKSGRHNRQREAEQRREQAAVTAQTQQTLVEKVEWKPEQQSGSFDFKIVLTLAYFASHSPSSSSFKPRAGRGTDGTMVPIELTIAS